MNTIRLNLLKSYNVESSYVFFGKKKDNNKNNSSSNKTITKNVIIKFSLKHMYSWPDHKMTTFTQKSHTHKAVTVPAGLGRVQGCYNTLPHPG